MHRFPISLLIIAPLITHQAFPQKVMNIVFRPKGQQIEVRYDLAGAKFYQTFHVDLYVSLDGGRNFQGPLQMVEGAVGDSVLPGREKVILWDVFKEIPTFDGRNVGFNVVVEVDERERRRKYYAGYTGSYKAPVGLTAGIAGKTGFYLSARIHPMNFTQVPYVTKGGFIDTYPDEGYYEYTSEKSYQRLSVTSGLTFQLGWHTHLYLGMGFAQYNHLWNIDQYEYPQEKAGNSWVKQTDLSFDRIELEGGFHFNFEHLFFTMGITSPNFEWAEPVFSLGFTF